VFLTLLGVVMAGIRLVGCHGGRVFNNVIAGGDIGIDATDCFNLRIDNNRFFRVSSPVRGRGVNGLSATNNESVSTGFNPKLTFSAWLVFVYINQSERW
jgi:parallel beta-helix repeat protein